ncbi:hypothetical protein, partial [Pseudoxanthomonas sp. KAs_5_3]|uniref:hypothetical protein n=1 Tax=Pseudoxanthomonas sp. KAs_5_3 TaxID=2067658 RepID=UPI001E574275
MRYTCDHYMRECGNCPLLINARDNDISHKIWQQKRKAYDVLNFTVAAPSTWMQASVQKSSLMEGKVVSHIPNTLETD